MRIHENCDGNNVVFAELVDLKLAFIRILGITNLNPFTCEGSIAS